MENALAAQALGRARTATLVAVGPSDRLTDVSATLNAEDGAGALHVVRIITDGTGSPDGDERPDIVTIGGLRPEYVNNAIAGVRLSSLPTIVWWRGGRAEGLEGVASLADRVVLDATDPWPLWSRLPPLFDQTAFTDVRWARLTRWRAALAHFFDLPRVQESAAALTSPQAGWRWWKPSKRWTCDPTGPSSGQSFARGARSSCPTAGRAIGEC